MLRKSAPTTRTAHVVYSFAHLWLCAVRTRYVRSPVRLEVKALRHLALPPDSVAGCAVDNTCNVATEMDPTSKGRCIGTVHHAAASRAAGRERSLIEVQTTSNLKRTAEVHGRGAHPSSTQPCDTVPHDSGCMVPQGASATCASRLRLHGASRRRCHRRCGTRWYPTPDHPFPQSLSTIALVSHTRPAGEERDCGKGWLG